MFTLSRRLLSAALAAITLSALLPVAASAEPIDTWPITHGIDCLHDRFNPVDDEGRRDPAEEPQPGSAEWDERDAERLACARQRDHDRRYHHGISYLTSARYGEDLYRQPVRHDERRFRYDYFPAGTGLPTSTGYEEAPAFEVYRPCDNESCPNIMPGLERIDGPYPVVIVHHGFIAQMTHHRFNAQAFAEAGYLAITVNGSHPVTGAPNVQRNVNAGYIMDWLASPESGDIGAAADLDRIIVAGHSQGAAAARSYQGDPRVDAIIAWDGGDELDEVNTSQPIMFQRTDGAFSAPQDGAHPGYPAGRDRGLKAYQVSKERGLDVFHVTLRATNHIDWNGNGVGSLAGNRWAELVINYYSLAWLDRWGRGLLVLNEDGSVKTSGGRTAFQERAYRQSIAYDAYRRLTAMRFDDSADRHNTSMGWFDPVQLATSGDPVFGGNVPYRIDGQWVTERFSPEYRSFCLVTAPNYFSGGVLARTDSGEGGDMYLTGCSS